MASGAPILDTISIDSISVDSYKAPLAEEGYFKIESNQGNSTIRLANMYLSLSVGDVLPLDSTIIGKEVTIQRGEASATETYIFRGDVYKTFLNGGRVNVVGIDKLYRTTKVKLAKTYDINIDPEAGVISEIFKSIVLLCGLNADATSIQDSGTTLTLNKFRCNNCTAFDALKRLSDALGWQFYYNPVTDKVNFEPKGYQNQTTQIEAGTNLVSIPKWEIDSANLANRVTVNGAVQEVETTESGQIGVTSGYTTTYVQLEHIPESTKVYANSSNPPTTLRSGGVVNSTVTFDYSVDKPNAKIEWNTGTYAPIANDYCKIDYSYYEPVPVEIADSVSRDTYSNGTYADLIIDKFDLIDVEDAELYASQTLSDRKDPIIKTDRVIVTDVSDLAVGQSVPINDTWNNINQNFIVTSVTMRGPYRADIISVVSNIIDEDDYEYNVTQRVKRLEEQQSGDTSILLQVINLSRTTAYQRRRSDVMKADYSGTGANVFFLGSADYGKLGASGQRDYTADAVGFWPLQNSPANMVESGNDAVVTGTTKVADRFGRSERAYSLNGWGDNLTIADHASLDITSAITIAGWFYNRQPKVTINYQGESYPGAVGDNFGSYRRARTSTDSAGVMVSIPVTNTVYGSTRIEVQGYTSAGGTSGILTITATDDVTAEVLFTSSTIKSRTSNGQLIFDNFAVKGNNYTITITFLDVQDVYIDYVSIAQPGRATILTKRESAYELIVSDGNYRIRMTVGGVSRSWDTGVAVSSLAWTFYTLTYDSTTLRFYINGSQVYSSTTYSGAIGTNSQSITIGAINGFGSTSGTSMYAYFGEQAIFDRALSAAEVSDYYTKTSTSYLQNGLGDNSGQTETLVKRVQGNNTYKDYVEDTTFYDSANSSGVTWDTGAKTITISDGYLVSKVIALGYAFSNYKVSLASVTGDTGYYTVEISGDGKSTWETVVEDVTTPFTTSTTAGVYLRITSDVAGGFPTAWGTWGSSATIVLNNTYKSGGNYNEPAIKVELS